VRLEAAREMGESPSEAACRSGFQTTLSCSGKGAMVVNVKEKSHDKGSCEVRFRETSESDPLTRYRKVKEPFKVRDEGSKFME